MSPKGRLRKEIQIATTENVLTVLCDDGTIWEIDSDGKTLGVWRRVPRVPQTNKELNNG